MTRILVAYGTRYGSTREVAETVAATLGVQGIDTDVKQARDVRSLNGYDAVVLEAPLSISMKLPSPMAQPERAPERPTTQAGLPTSVIALVVSR